MSYVYQMIPEQNQSQETFLSHHMVRDHIQEDVVKDF